METTSKAAGLASTAGAGDAVETGEVVGVWAFTRLAEKIATRQNLWIMVSPSHRI